MNTLKNYLKEFKLAGMFNAVEQRILYANDNSCLASRKISFYRQIFFPFFGIKKYLMHLLLFPPLNVDCDH